MAPPTQQSGSSDVKKVMISSTALDLPDHRDLVKDACLRQGMFPIMMEHLPAADADAIAESLRMVNEADIYLGIFAYSYGYIPKGYDISVTEMEYNRAAERGIPRLIFLMDKDHPVKPTDVETGDGSVKIEALKTLLKKERVVNFFKSPAELQAEVIDSLSKLRQPNLTAFHYISDIPEPPEPYIAHPYTLLQTSLVGRQAELNLLTDWVAKPSSNLYYEAAIKAATEAFRLAWCDGPPFAYHWGLQKAKAHLAELGVPEPILPPFDESKYEPMPEFEIEP